MDFGFFKLTCDAGASGWLWFAVIWYVCAAVYYSFKQGNSIPTALAFPLVFALMPAMAIGSGVRKLYEKTFG